MRVTGGARTTGARLAVLVVVAVVLVLRAPGLSRYSLDIGTTVLVYLCATQGWNILAGYAGEYSLMSSAFIGAGAYTSALVAIHLGWPPAGLVAAGVVCGVVLSLLLSVPLLRVRGDYFTIASLAAALAVQALVTNLHVLGGAAGLNLPIDGLPSGAALFQLGVVCAALAAAVSVLVRGSSLGLRLMALRDDAGAAEGVGINVFRHRLGALVLSGGLIAMAGSVLALQQVGVQPTGSLDLSWTINVVLMGTVGGAGTLLGPLVGVVVIYYGLIEQLSGTPTLGLVIEGLVLIAIVLLAPRGVWPKALSLLSPVLRRLSPRRARTPVAGGDGGDGAEALEPDPVPTSR